MDSLDVHNKQTVFEFRKANVDKPGLKPAPAGIGLRFTVAEQLQHVLAELPHAPLARAGVGEDMPRLFRNGESQPDSSGCGL